jgi:hypothetical protein
MFTIPPLLIGNKGILGRVLAREKGGIGEQKARTVKKAVKAVY